VERGDFISLLQRALMLSPDNTAGEVLTMACEAIWPRMKLEKLYDCDLCHALRQYIFTKRPRDCMKFKGQ
jgi:hypothetical protein